MFRLPFGERVDPMEEKRQARQNTINNVLTFCMLCAAIRIVGFSVHLVKVIKAALTPKPKPSCNPCGYYY